MRKVRLGVNIDHVATVREARKTYEPSPVHAAVLAQLAGADQITLHVREDRRHVNEKDLELICKVVNIPVNLEMAPTKEMQEIALKNKPYQITLVPEKRQEITTEGGLDVISLKEYLKDYIKPFKKEGIKVNIFIDPDKEQIAAAKEIGADSIEIHTGTYANAKTEEEQEKELQKIKEAAKFAKSIGLKVFAGHGLTYQNVSKIAQIPEIEELNIGHSIVANAILFGFQKAVKKMKEIIEKSSK